MGQKNKLVNEGAKFHSHGSGILREDDGFTIQSCFVVVKKTMKPPTHGWMFYVFNHSHGLALVSMEHDHKE